MSQEIKIEIISPDKSIFSGKSEEAILPCFEGQVTILRDHIPLITFLRPGFIEIGKNEKFYVEDGTVEFTDNNLLILTSTAKDLLNMNKSTINALISDAEERLNKNEITDKEKYLIAHKINTLKNIT